MTVDERLIYDVGAHKGEDTGFYLKKGFSVVAIEANPEFCSEINDRFREFVRANRLAVLNLAITSGSGSVQFYVDEVMSVWGTTNRDWVSRNRQFGAGRTKEICVQSEPLARVMQDRGVPYYCKIDIEGNDLDALRSLSSLQEKPRYISIESEKQNWNKLIEEFVVFRSLGFSRFKIVDQSLVQLQSCPVPPREGDCCEHSFERGSSGLFGEELPGGWLSLFDAIEGYRHIFLNYALSGDHGLFAESGFLSFFRVLAALQSKLARLRKAPAYVNPSYIMPQAGWYDTHAAR